MLSRLLVVGYGLLVLLTGCSGEGNPEPTQPPTPPSLAQQAYMKASNAAANSTFGGAIALDGNTIVVGAQSEGTGALRSGAAYVFIRNGTGWTEQAILKAANINADERFGASVALSGNVLVVGAPAPPNPGGNPIGSGSVYVFTRSGTAWSQQARITASNAQLSDDFGRSVALDGNTLVVGAPGEDSALTDVISNNPDEGITGDGAENSGAVYVFTHNGAAWTQQAYVKASNTGSGDSFGRSVALDGNTLVVGASEGSSLTGVTAGSPDEVATGNSAVGSGAVYVFTRNGATWSQQAYVKASNTGAGDNFGIRVALTGNTLAVGATGEDSNLTGVTAGSPDETATGNGAAGSGAVYVFTRNGTTWIQQTYVKASNTEAGDSFGRGLALTDGLLTIGAPSKDGNTGAAYVFARTGTTWAERAKIKGANTEANDNFGGNVALTGPTLTNATLLVGAIGEASKAQGINKTDLQGDNSAPQSGAVYVMQ